MSAPASAKAFGMKLGAEPRKLAILGALVAVAVVVFFLNSGGDGNPVQPPVTSSSSAAATNQTLPGTTRPHIRRRLQRGSGDRNTLRMEEVTLEASRGDIDPTLRLDLLQRLKTVKSAGDSRNLFQAGAVITPDMAASKPVKIVPGPLPQRPGATVTPGQPGGPAGPAPIPLKFYGFSAPANASGVRRGFFLDQDNIIVANEGDTVMGRFRIIGLQAKAAEVEDLVTKSRQTLPIVPELSQGGL